MQGSKGDRDVKNSLQLGLSENFGLSGERRE